MINVSTSLYCLTPTGGQPMPHLPPLDCIVCVLSLNQVKFELRYQDKGLNLSNYEGYISGELAYDLEKAEAISPISQQH
jgi:hypothetical protein